MKVYGPYTGKDGRQRVILHENGKGNTVSYPKFLVENQIGNLEKEINLDHFVVDLVQESTEKKFKWE